MATSGRSQTWNSSFLQNILGKAAITAPVGAYLALLSSTPTSDTGTGQVGTLTELVTGTSPSYARATIDAANASSAWSSTTQDSTGTWKTNAAVISFPQATGAWLAATGFAIYDAATVGTLLYWGTFGSSITISNGATASVAIGALKVTEA
jgi:hypothetical protein